MQALQWGAWYINCICMHQIFSSAFGILHTVQLPFQFELLQQYSSDVMEANSSNEFSQALIPMQDSQETWEDLMHMHAINIPGSLPYLAP